MPSSSLGCTGDVLQFHRFRRAASPLRSLAANSPLNAASDTVRSAERHGAWWTGASLSAFLSFQFGP
jgi:hypothetical protein